MNRLSSSARLADSTSMRRFDLALRTVFVWMAALAFLTASVHAHPFHTTSAEMEFNSSSGRYEVSLRVLATDLEEALTRQASAKSGAMHSETLPGGRDGSARRPVGRIVLTPTADVDEHIVAYLKNAFALTKEDAGPGINESTRFKPAQGFHWVGKEMENSWVWLYFELDAPPDRSRAALKNTVFLELNAGQINICTLRTRGSKFSLRTDAKCAIVALPPNVR